MRKTLSSLSLLALLLAAGTASALAQTPGPAPRRLTFDGHSEPYAWNADGILVARPGGELRTGNNVRIAMELWQLDPASGAGRQLSADAVVPARSTRAPAGAPSLSVVNGPALNPELWLTDASGVPTRLLLRGAREYFDQPLFSPDGSRYVFARTPTGSATRDASELWAGSAGRPPRLLVAGASTPVWSPDGRLLAVLHGGDVYLVDSTTTTYGWDRPDVPLALPAPSRPASLTPPPTIRVYHTQANHDFSQTATCRDKTLPAGAITTLALEDYVRFVLPIEASPGDPPESLKAQAVASRTYAWACINHTGICTGNSHPSYDITDWTGDQAMCELRVAARTDSAQAATNSQYVSWNGAVAAALYSANNSDPTATNPTEFASPGAYPYLRAVDDPVTFGDTRSGHGQGLSQIGAIRWASNFEWDYIQILAHYYSGVTIEGATNFGSLTAPGNDLWQTSNRARIQGNASNAGRFDVTAYGDGLAATQVATQTLLTVLDLSAVPDQPLGSLVISGTLAASQAATLTVGLDRSTPAGTLDAPATTFGPTVTLQLSGTAPGPSGYAGYGLSNDWRWEGEAKKTAGNVAGAGVIVSDSAALNGQALFAPAGSGSGVWYGPYAFNLPPGHAYRAWFRLKAGSVSAPVEIAKLDVVADGVHPIGIRHLYRTEFRAANVYQEFSVDFNAIATPTTGLEFRVDFPGGVDLSLDRVLVATYPAPAPQLRTWVLPSSAPGPYVVIAKFSDHAGNVSPDLTQTIWLGTPLRVFLPFLQR